MRIEATKVFNKNFKRLKKKYPSFETDFGEFIEELQNNPIAGADIGGGFRKIRMSVKSKGKGKSGGMRVITFNYLLNTDNGMIVLVTIYDKSEHDSISDEQIRDALNSL